MKFIYHPHAHKISAIDLVDQYFYYKIPKEYDNQIWLYYGPKHLGMGPRPKDGRDTSTHWKTFVNNKSAQRGMDTLAKHLDALVFAETGYRVEL